MIYDQIRNAPLYFKSCKGMARAFKFYREKCSRGIKCGKYDVGGGTFAIVMEYKTKTPSEAFFETHRKYIDIQIVLEGIETAGVANIKDCRITQKYDHGKDLQKLAGGKDSITLKKGMFAVFFPHDAHMPGIRVGGKKAGVKKIVFKLPV